MIDVSMQVDELPGIVEALVKGKMSWDQVLQKYPLFTGQEATQ